MDVSSFSDSFVRFVEPYGEGSPVDGSAYGPIGTDPGSSSSTSQAPLESSHSCATSSPSAIRPGPRSLQTSAISVSPLSARVQPDPPSGSVTLSAYSWVSVIVGGPHPGAPSVSKITATDGPVAHPVPLVS